MPTVILDQAEWYGEGMQNDFHTMLTLMWNISRHLPRQASELYSMWSKQQNKIEGAQ